MKIEDAVKYVSQRFQYRADKKIFFDYWMVMKDVNGVMKGDCDDFAFTSIWKRCDENFLKLFWYVFVLHKFRMYFAMTPNKQKHIVGYADGLYFDNWTLEALPREEFLKRSNLS